MALYDASVSPGLGMVAEYDASGIPVVGELAPGQTATFTKVTRAVTFSACGESENAQGNARISFDGGTTAYVFGVTNDTNSSANNAHRVEVKCKTITNPVEIPANPDQLNIQFIAELTNIDADKCLDWNFADFCSITGP